MTPNELFSYLFYEMLVVPVAWTGSDLPIGDTPISTLIKVPVTFMLCVFFVTYIIRRVLKPVDVLLRKWILEEDLDDWDTMLWSLAVLGGVIGVSAVWRFYAEWLNL